MNQPKTVLLLNGSPKCEKSNSRVIAKFLVDKLEEKGLKSEEAFTARLAKSPEGSKKLAELVNSSDIVVFATPLYVDSLPSFTTKVMEMIRDNRQPQPQLKRPLLVAVMNCGFPEKEHMQIALKIIQNFSQEAKFRWSGAITVGMGMALNGQPLKEKNGMTRNLTKGLSIAAVALAEGQPIPAEAEKLTSKSFLPLFLAKSMLRMMGKRMWNSQAKGNDAQDLMYARPYESAE
jgi:multimeric flavodoxin WrbA